MSPHYQVTCSCGEPHAVRLSQAGQEIPCGCGRTVSIPLLGQLRKLPTVAVPEDKDERHSPVVRPRLPSLLVFFGLLFTTLALLASVALIFVRSQIDASWSIEGQRAHDGAIIDAMGSDETLDAWFRLRTEGLGNKNPTVYMLQRGSHTAIGSLLRWTLGATAVLGIATLVVSLLSRRATHDRRTGKSGVPR
ncbi:MAG: hypothetical protein U0935_06030 [Pirellulales bacterium]